MGKLTSKTVESLAKKEVPGKSNDGDGLYFQTSKAKACSWIFRYKFEGRSREMGLGPYPAISLSEARQLAAAQRKDARNNAYFFFYFARASREHVSRSLLGFTDNNHTRTCNRPVAA